MTTISDHILKVRDVHYAYHTAGVATPVLHGIDLELRRGEFVIIMGPSGCGKTTLLNIIGLMMPARSGTVELDGAEVSSLDDAGRASVRRNKLGFVFQRFNLLPVLTVEQNVSLALRLRGDQLDGQAIRILERVGLADKRHSKPNALSVGEQQRAAIARAVVRRPALLLADEPTGSLDSRNAQSVLDLLRELNASDGVTTLMITHNEHLADRADRVLFMHDGRFA
ncbi:MAG: ABC transporter ATP-binding protein [Planctomycetota bacterium]|nr:ABC transporter ATP-binding protein [Planctomycetota bacterium]